MRPPGNPSNTCQARLASELAAAVARCGECSELLRELREAYRRVDVRVAETGAVCLAGGSCCRFDLMDHRLYVSTGELALLVEAPPPVWPAVPGQCAYQLGPKCVARQRRPLGCRTYFCKGEQKQVLQTIHEEVHHLICDLHARLSTPYNYVELTGALTKCLPAAP